jgi:hypothetical protein
MVRYKNLDSHSGVLAYEAGDDFIKVQFTGGMIYLYNNKVTGKHNIERMKVLAIRGRGLSTYISTVVKDQYAFKSFSPPFDWGQSDTKRH